MSYWKGHNKNTKSVDRFDLTYNSHGNNAIQLEFHELELGIVLDVILDDKHPFITKGSSTFTKINVDKNPVSVYNIPALPTDTDYSLIGRVLVRPLISGKKLTKDSLIWAYPAESNISEYPLINETVVLSSFNDKTYYSRKLNHHNWVNNNLDFGIDLDSPPNTVLFTSSPFIGKEKSVTNWKKNEGYSGYAGKYFVANNRIRNLQRFEGDLNIESRFGQSIHFSSYDDNRGNDTGYKPYVDYSDFGGNPMILIRNRQRSLLKENETLSLHNSPNPATITGTSVEKNVGGYIQENINHDGSSIHITSGLTISKWVTTCYKKMFGNTEEVSKFNGYTSFVYPELNKDQIIINSDRLIFSSRYGELFQYSKKRFGIVTDSEYTVDAHDQIILTTNVKTVINSPAIYLGEYNQTNEPALLGQTTVNWLYELCNWLLEHVHQYKHGHENPSAGNANPDQSQTVLPPQIQQLVALRATLKTLMSKRVFVTGGGFAPGSNGASITDGTPPTKIDVGSGTGVPGGWNGQNYRT